MQLEQLWKWIAGICDGALFVIGVEKKVSRYFRLQQFEVRKLKRFASVKDGEDKSFGNAETQASCFLMTD
jgi:hypothetical protein